MSVHTILLGLSGMLLYLIRHGESLYNREGRIQGQTDVELSDFGLRQADAVVQGMDSIELDAVFSSPLKRAYQTAVPLAQSKQLTIQVQQDLKEINVGAFAGLKWPEVTQRFPEHSAPWERQDMDFVIPGGESRRMLQERGVRALQEISKLPFEKVAIVAHGGLLCAALKGILQLPDQLNPFSLFNASISRLVWDGRWQVLTLNQTEHLVKAGVVNESGKGNL